MPAGPHREDSNYEGLTDASGNPVGQNLYGSSGARSPSGWVNIGGGRFFQLNEPGDIYNPYFQGSLIKDPTYGDVVPEAVINSPVFQQHLRDVQASTMKGSWEDNYLPMLGMAMMGGPMFSAALGGAGAATEAGASAASSGATTGAGGMGDWLSELFNSYSVDPFTGDVVMNGAGGAGAAGSGGFPMPEPTAPPPAAQVPQYGPGLDYTPGAYTPSGGGMPNMPTGTNSIIQQLVKSLLGGGSPTGGLAGAGGTTTGAGALGGAGSLGGLGGIITGLMSLFGNNMIDPAKANALFSAGQDTYNSALDPQQAMYGRTLQQLQDQTRASSSAHGTAMSPYAAGIENKSLSDFNVDWVNSMLNRRAAGLRGFSDAAATSFGQSNKDRQFSTDQNAAGTNALLTGASQAGPWLSNLFNTGNTSSGAIPNTAAYDAYGNDSFTA